jgi:translation initiation factor 5A
MVAKVINATEMRVGTFLLLDGTAHQLKKMDISKTGKHGHAKVRYEASNIFTGKKKVGVIPGHDKIEVPHIDKRNGQVLSVHGNIASIMDSENFENMDMEVMEGVVGINEGTEVEYWDVEGDKLLKRAL